MASKLPGTARIQIETLRNVPGKFEGELERQE
jgi:hypothetical protein